MKGKIKGCALLLILTLALSGCVAVKIEEGVDVGGQKPVGTEAPETTKTPKATEVPETTKTPEITEEPVATVTPEVTETPAATDAPEVTPALEPLVSDTVISPEDTVVPLAMGSTVSVDLNGDGVQELVQVSFGSVSGSQTDSKSQWSAMDYALPVIRINDYVYDEEYLQENVGYYAENADIATWYIFDVDVNDGYKEIGLHEEGPSDDPYTTLFRYEDGVLRSIGGFSDSPIRESRGSWALQEGDDYQALIDSLDRSNIQIEVPGDGTIYATQRIDILETSFAEGLWKLQNSDSFAEAVLELQTREEYEYKGYEERKNSEYCPYVHGELQVFAQKDLTSEVVVLAHGEKVILYHFYPDVEGESKDGWVELLYGENFQTSAWIYVDNYFQIYQANINGEEKYVGSHELIDNLSFAD